VDRATDIKGDEALLREALAETLGGLRVLEDAGDNKAHHAAAVLLGRNGGRPSIDDSALLAEVRELRATRGCAAVRIVARRHATPEMSAASLAQRLRRKLREEKYIK